MHLQIQHPTDKQPEGFNLLTNEDESTGMEGTAVDSMVEDFTAGDGGKVHEHYLFIRSFKTMNVSEECQGYSRGRWFLRFSC